MTHYNIDYSTIDNNAEKEAKAIQDIKDYVGVDKFNKAHASLVELRQAEKLSLEKLEFMLMLPGISGFPCVAWFNLIKKDAGK